MISNHPQASRKRVRSCIFLSLLVLAHVVHGQPDPDEKKEETFDLPAFEVSTSKDQGYFVSNSTAGTRIDEEIRNIPIAIQSISREFLDDTGAYDLESAVEYSAGIQNTGVSNVGEASLEDDRESNYKIRGMITGNSLRDGNWRFYRTDGTIIERVEVVRGPSSLLYGIGSFNGIINTLTRKPLFKEQTEVDLRFGNMDFQRFELDHQGMIGETSAYRIVAARTDFGHWIDNQSSDSTVVFASVRIRPSRGWLIDFSHEYFDDFRRPGHKFVEDVNLDLADENGFVKVPDIRTFSWQAPQQKRDNEFNETTLTVTREWGQSTLRLSYVRSDLEMLRLSHGVGLHQSPRDKLEIIPVDGAPGGGEFFRPTIDPSLFREDGVVLKAVPSERIETVLVDQFRMEWTHVVDTDWGLHRFLLGAHYLPDYETYVRHGLAYDYDDDHLLAFYKRPDDFTPFQLPDFDTNAELNHRSNFNDDFGAYFVHIGKFMNQRLNTITGIRYDWSRSTRYTYHDNGQLNEDVGDGGVSLGESVDHWTPQVGLNYEFSKDLSAYVTTAGGRNPNYSPTDGNQNSFSPTTSRGYEAGLKADLFDSKLSGTMAFFNTERDGTVYYDRTAFNNDPSSGGYGTFIRVDDKAYGIDMQLHWRPTRSLDFLLTYAWTETELTDVDEYVEPTLIGENVDEFGTPIPHVRGFASSDYLEGQQLNDTPVHSGTLWTRYVFREGVTKGFHVGVGLKYLGERVYQSRRRYASDESPLATISEQLLVDLSLRYRPPFKRLSGLDIQLNVRNVFDNQDLQGDRFEQPRRYWLSAGYTF